MNKLFCVLLVILCPFFINAEKSLTKDLVQALTASLAGFEQLTVEFPKLEDSLDQSGLYTDKVKALKPLNLYLTIQK
jgi:hypothetical protein